MPRAASICIDESHQPSCMRSLSATALGCEGASCPEMSGNSGYGAGVMQWLAVFLILGGMGSGSSGLNGCGRER